MLNTKPTLMKNKRLLIILSVAGILLLVPLVAMQLTDTFNWSMFDFMIAGALLFGVGLMCDLVLRVVTNRKHRVVACTLLLLLFLLVWAELAVGVLGTSIAGS